MTRDQEREVVLAALADATRRLLMDLLASHGEASATTLAADMPVSRQAVVKHLGILNAAGLVSGERVGREMRYKIRTEPLEATARWMSRLATQWDKRLLTIKRLAEMDDETDR
ncbi:MAG TPA: metalloregulator ArsR/SmtB family transcription factor [Bacilli bacterium]|nr:metalloregulator ArsR/SmtB family transcription factor [Bacilli bacterium]